MYAYQYRLLGIGVALLMSCTDNNVVPDFIKVGRTYTALVEENQPPQRFKVVVIDKKKGWIKVEGVYGNSYWLDVTQIKVLNDTLEP